MSPNLRLAEKTQAGIRFRQNRIQIRETYLKVKADGESVATTSLPAGTYTIEETTPTAIENYTYTGVTYAVDGKEPTNTVTVTIAENKETVAVTATNNYIRLKGDLRINKYVSAFKGVEIPDETFTFTIKNGDAVVDHAYTLINEKGKVEKKETVNGTL
ncbi:MAG: DUF5979 domain-containing protein, partial [Victivallaceae bacterium]